MDYIAKRYKKRSDDTTGLFNNLDFFIEYINKDTLASYIANVPYGSTNWTVGSLYPFFSASLKAFPRFRDAATNLLSGLSVNHSVLLNLLKSKIKDQDIIRLLKEVISSFCSCHKLLDSRLRRNDECRGIPLGNLTSQIFANIYLNELDQFIKHRLKVKYYLRYADDFLLLSGDKQSLERLIVTIGNFLGSHLKLEVHPKKIIFRNLNWGIDFLGYIVLPHYILPRTKTKRRIFKKLTEKLGSENFNASLQSYLGYLSHANSYRIEQQLKNNFGFLIE